MFNCNNRAIYSDGIITMPPTTLKIDTKGIGHQYFTSMTRHKDKIFQIDGITGKKETFGEALQRCIRTAIKMQSLGVTTNDIVTICSLNTLDTCIPYLATFFVGGVVANLDPLIPVDDSIHLIKQIDPKIIFVEENSVNLIETILKASGKTSKIVVFGHSDKYTNFCEFLVHSPEEQKFVPAEVDVSQTAIILFSSGSTGLPKGICLSHTAHLRQVNLLLESEKSFDQLLAFARLYWSTAVLFHGISIVSGSSKIIIPKFDVDLIWNVIEKFKPNFMYASPFQMATLCSCKNVFNRNVSCLNVVYMAGGIIFEHQISLYRKIFSNAKIKIGYGLSETGNLTYFPTNTKEQSDHLDAKLNTVGSALNGVCYKVVDIDSGNILGPWCSGELVVKGETIMNGYYNLDSSEAWDSDGWLRTGDILYYDEDLYFYYVQRLKELIKYQTMHVPPKVIENVLLSHPNVKEARVIGILHEVDGEHPMAIVQLKDLSQKNNIKKDLYDLVASKLDDRYKLRGGVKIITEFPSTVSGKIDMIKLKRLFASNKI